MSGHRTILPCLFLCAGSLPAQAPSLEPVHRAELAFAQLAADKGIRTGFLGWLAEDAWAFTPRMTSAKAFYGQEPGDPGHLAWYPEEMGLAASGDLAWSFGPWTYARKKGEPVLVNGHFLSIWQRQGSGQWRVEADIGVPHAAPERPIRPFAAPGVGPLPAAIPGTKALDTQALLQQKEGDLARAWTKQGGLALLPLLSTEACLLRSGRMPLRGAPDIRKALENDPPAPGGREPSRLQVASSGDLAWVCGEAGPDGRGTGASFLRVWVLEGGAWKVRFDVRLAHPGGS